MHRPLRASFRGTTITALCCLGLIGASLSAQSAAQNETVQQAQQLIGASKFDSASALLEPLVKDVPAFGRAWLSLGAARRGAGQIDAAAAALEHAAALPRARQPAVQALFLLYAGAGRLDQAYRWFDEMQRARRGDFTGVVGNPEIAALKSDRRFALLFPTPASFAKPFVEPVKIIHEWRGETPGDEFGWIARGIGDVDGDGVTDVVISATGNRPYGNANGKIYVYSGKSGKLLWKREGDQGALLGLGLEAAGDVDGDGIPDVVAGAPGINTVFVYSGRDGREILRMRGDPADVDLGVHVAGIGDFDGDGRPEIVAGAPSSNAGGIGAFTGRVYVFSGKDGHRLLTLDGARAGDGFGSSVDGGDGRYLIVGAPGAGANHAGEIFIYDHLTATPKFVEEADSSGVALGAMFSSVIGDVDGDGTPDIYASDYPNAAKGPATGRLYVYSGKTGATILTVTGDSAGGGFGIGAARIGDVDGDGRADLIVGSWQYGGAAWSGGRVQLISGRDGHVLRTITGRITGETFGFDAVGIGDVDGDGVTDYLVTSAWSMVNGLRSGRVYVISGKDPAKRTR
ncbi:MAG: FG-GAP-like repeat-containing protein [Gemmatimonadales bacterium]